MKLTKKYIDSIGYRGDGASRDVHWDESIPGLGVRVYPSGKIAFVLSYRFEGRKRLYTLGRYGVITLDQARQLARELLVQISKGEEPLDSRKKKNSQFTIKELCEMYLVRYAKPHKRSWKDDERRILNYLIPVWGNFKSDSLEHNDVARFHRKLGLSKPYEANRIVELISKMYNLAQKWSVVSTAHINPAKGVEPFKEQKRDRWVKPEELVPLFEAISQEKSIYVKAAILLYLLTGARKNEILTAKWEHVDWHTKELKIPENKSGRVHYIPLIKPAIELLRILPQLASNPFIIPGAKEGAHLINIHKPWQRIRKRAGIEDVRLHDLRRTVGSWLAQSGNDLHLIGKLLNHKSQSTTAVYSHFGQNHLRDALENHGEKIMAAANLIEISNLIQ